MEAKLRALENKFDDMRVDYKLSLTQTEQVFGKRVEKLAEMFEVETSSKESAAEAGKRNPLKEVIDKVTAIEEKFEKLRSASYTRGTIYPELDRIGMSEAELSTPSGQENFKLETQLKLQMMAQEINSMKLTLDAPVASAAVKSSPKSPQGMDTTVMTVRVGSLADRLSDLEKRPDYGFLVNSQSELERRVKNLTESLNIVLTWQRDFSQSQTKSKLHIPAPELIIPQLSLSEIQPIRTEEAPLTDNSASHGSGLNELWAAIGELNLRVKMMTTKEEMNSFIDSVYSRFKLEEARAKVPGNSGGGKGDDDDIRRVAELEQRVVASAKSLSDLQEELKHLKQLSAHQLQTAKTFLESKLDEAKSSLSSLDRKYLVKMEELSIACERRSQSCPYEDDMTMTRSLIMKLRSDVQVIRDIQDAQQVHPEEPAPIVSLNLDQISDSPELTAVKSALQQHDQAIKYLSSKLSTMTATTGVDELAANRQELTLALHRLDEMKTEMAEIIAKQEASKTLTQKDYELLNEIYGVLDTKIGKDDLVQKVDKEELNKMFKVLKRKTDALAEHLRKAEQLQPQTTREDAYFLRKRLDKECAACGQNLPETTDVQNFAYLSWSKFPARTANIGPGFSRILNSLVMSPDGSMRLPDRLSPRTDSLEDVSGNMSGMHTSKSAKKSIRLDLQSESTSRHKVNVSTRLPAVKTSGTKT